MTRVKRGTTSVKTRHNVLKQTKGFRNARKSKERQAYEALMHAGAYSFAHRRDKKGDFRGLWQMRISAALASHDVSYSAFMGAMKKKGIILNRKMLSEIAETRPKTFERIVLQILAK
jgi:large subunit ribosomal protein L20